MLYSFSTVRHLYITCYTVLVLYDIYNAFYGTFSVYAYDPDINCVGGALGRGGGVGRAGRGGAWTESRIHRNVQIRVNQHSLAHKILGVLNSSAVFGRSWRPVV